MSSKRSSLVINSEPIVTTVLPAKKKEKNIYAYDNCFVVRGEIDKITYNEAFYFDKKDEASIDLAYRKALVYRDAKLLVSYKSNTGYKCISIEEAGIRDKNDKFYLQLKVSSANSPLNKRVYFGDTCSYKKALNVALELLCENQNTGIPISITYDYGLHTAFQLGYIAKDEEPTVVSTLIRVGGDITDPTTGEIGRICSIIDDTCIAAKFETGERTRLIKNEILALNMMSNRNDTIKELDIKLKDKNLSNEDFLELSLKANILEKENVETYRQVIENKAVSSKTFNKMLEDTMMSGIKPLNVINNPIKLKLLK